MNLFLKGDKVQYPKVTKNLFQSQNLQNLQQREMNSKKLSKLILDNKNQKKKVIRQTYSKKIKKMILSLLKNKNSIPLNLKRWN